MLLHIFWPAVGTLGTELLPLLSLLVSLFALFPCRAEEVSDKTMHQAGQSGLAGTGKLPSSRPLAWKPKGRGPKPSTPKSPSSSVRHLRLLKHGAGVLPTNLPLHR